ncbi:PREDICTED: VQ motif-containing protein 8, chloroplastic [Nelumbo nucifera]|uniref:VQ domain-containing protein n=2 Tax=Nelumbo nucifera TaxID=4432 RepID=A0A822YJU7_NELNU|nr:PREDICTED: VQ motif-containing protein 8, chloroplastic [Nelumbo nucifera]DAD31801.1 TPA_asm: hypothetical protein HUJ06_010652 [Nelumbo nucifera]
MSPAQSSHHDQQLKREINGSRPSPLKINKDSHFIQKPSSSAHSPSSTSSSSCFSGVAAAASNKQQQRHPPVIIYTHSPKIIHTQARDFMALVQKLTGLSRSEDQSVQSHQDTAGQVSSSKTNNNNIKPGGHDDTESSSVVTDENCVGGGDVQVSSSSISPVSEAPQSYFSDIPLFTPNAAELFCAPRPLYRYPDTVLTPSNIGSSISPSPLEVMKGLQEY